LPSENSWMEWIINAPNLAILVVWIQLFLKIPYDLKEKKQIKVNNAFIHLPVFVFIKKYSLS
jgi:hypothetical protein